MISTIKKWFFTGIFAVLYISFIIQFIYVLTGFSDKATMFIGLGLLSVEWLILISARYLSKRSSSSNIRGQENGFYGNHYRR